MAPPIADPPTTLEGWNRLAQGALPGLIGIDFTEVTAGRVAARLTVRRELLAPNGYLHAATIVAMADTASGYGTRATMPEGASGFTTVELKSNFLGTAREGELGCVATPAHLGRSTQVWDATVTHTDSGRTIALFRCTQMILWPKD